MAKGGEKGRGWRKGARRGYIYAGQVFRFHGIIKGSRATWNSISACCRRWCHRQLRRNVFFSLPFFSREEGVESGFFRGCREVFFFFFAGNFWFSDYFFALINFEGKNSRLLCTWRFSVLILISIFTRNFHSVSLKIFWISRMRESLRKRKVKFKGEV